MLGKLWIYFIRTKTIEGKIKIQDTDDENTGERFKVYSTAFRCNFNCSTANKKSLIAAKFSNGFNFQLVAFIYLASQKRCLNMITVAVTRRFLNFQQTLSGFCAFLAKFCQMPPYFWHYGVPFPLMLAIETMTNSVKVVF